MMRTGVLCLLLPVLICGMAGAEDELVIVAHRGANHVAPENTRAAAQVCIDLGVHYVEVDVHQSRDGVFYIMHDRTVDRTTDGTGRIAMMDSEAIDRLDAGSWFSEEYAGEPVPRLCAYLEWIKGQAKVFIDVKAGNMQDLIDLVYETGFEQDCFFWFGNDFLLDEFRAIDRELTLKINAHTPDEVIAAVEDYGASIVETQLASLTPEFVDVCRELDVRIMVYEKEDTPEMYRRIMASEADMINLDRPELFVEVRDLVRREAAQEQE